LGKISMKNIIILDDEHIYISVIQDLLNMQGYQTETATSPLEALKIMRQKPFDLLITDYMMSEMNGLELCEAVKSDEKLQDMKLLILSAKQMDTEEMRRITDLGALTLKKPFSTLLLKESLDRMFA